MPNPPVDPAVQRRITVTLFVVQSIFGAALIATFTLTSIVAARLSGFESLAGVPSTLVLGGRALIGYPIGWIMDRYGRRPAFVIGYALGAVGMLISVSGIVQASFWLFCAGAGVIGMGRGISEQTRYAAAEVYPPHQRAKVIGWLVFAGTIGSIGGPLLVPPSSGWVARFGLDPQTGPFVLAAVLSVFALALTFFFLRPDPLVIGRQMDDAQQTKHNTAPARPLREIFAGSAVRLAVAAMVIGQLVMTSIMVITPLHMAHHNHGLQAVSWVLMAHTLGMFGLATVTGWLIDRLGRASMIMIGGATLAVASLLTPVSTNMWVLAFALFLLGLGWSFCFVAGSALFSDSVAAHERGRAQGFSETWVALASGAGSLGTGVAFHYGGIVMVSAIGLAFSLIFLAGAFWSAQQSGLA
ncbi:MAG: MFS transporter, partial [Chloroflexota bacterium]|nr:MFS transporter [Chloroflexota bacterium]